MQIAPLVSNTLRHVPDHVPEDVEPDQINRAERSRARPADRLTGERVHVFNAHAHFLHEPHHVQHRKRPDPVADEIRLIFAQDDALAERVRGKLQHGGDDFGFLGATGGGREAVVEVHAEAKALLFGLGHHLFGVLGVGAETGELGGARGPA